MWNFGYHLARAGGAAARRAYSALLPLLLSQRIANDRSLELDVFAYSGEATLPEQIASTRSFLKFAGRPREFTIVCDGTYESRSISLLRKIDPLVRVASIAEFQPPNVSPKMRDYLSNHPTGKQLGIIMSLPRAAPALYIDSDVLFFPRAREIRQLLEANSAPAFYLRDCQFAGDERLLRNPTEKAVPVNTGVLLLLRALDWSLPLERFAQLSGAPNFFTNQTLVQLAMQANGAPPLDPRNFVLALDDQFVWQDPYAGAKIALRHYVNPVRHKFWLAVL